MRGTWMRRLPGVTLALSAGLTIAMVPLSLGVEPVYDTVLYGLMSLALAGSGALVARKHPGNAVGWLLCATGLVSAVTELAEGYGRHPSLVGHVTAAWFAGWAWAWGAGALSPIFLLFPSGHLSSRRWRPVLGVALSGLVLSCVGGALGHGNDYQMPGGENPYAVDGVAVDAVFAVGQVLFLLGQLAAIASLVARYRKAGPDERRQLAWVAYSVSLLAVAGPAALLLYGSSVSVRVAIALVATLIPVSICIAILRYRLYDIDLVINRTVVYGLLTALLGSGYAMTTLLLGTALGQNSAWATAGATLTTAAAFAPLRTRLQDAVDRRFNRAKYDAFRQVDAFLEQLRLGRTAPEQIEALLREVLDEPDLGIGFLFPDTGDLVDLRGHDLAPGAGDRTTVRRDGLPVAVLLHPTAASPLAAAVAERAALAVEVARLRVEVRRRLAEVEASRARIVAAGYEERRRLERDLHDGAQQRLVSIGLTLRHAQHELGPSAVSLTLEDAVAEIGLAIADLRSLANGVRPPQLDHGLAGALRELASRTPLSMDVRVDTERYPHDLEAAAYFVACEAVTNAVKHASATRVSVAANLSLGQLVVSVSDDGVGGASAASGSGLRGLSDRVAAHGGSLTVDSRVGHGTTLTAELPCAS